MIIKALDHLGAFTIHDDIKCATAHSGIYEMPMDEATDEDGYNIGGKAFRFFHMYDLPRWAFHKVGIPEAAQPMANVDIWFDPAGQITVHTGERSKVMIIDADLKDGTHRRYFINQLAYICNDDGKTIHKVEMRY